MFGYLKKVARIDTCRGQESVRTMSAQESSVKNAILPQVRLMAPSISSSPSGRSSAPPSPNVFFCEQVKLHTTCDCDDEEEREADEAENEGKNELTSPEKGHKGRVHHLLPSSFLSLLPPGTPHSGRSSSSGFRSRPNSVSDEQTSISSIRAESPARRIKKNSKSDSEKKKRGHDLSNCDDQQKDQLQATILPLNSTLRRFSRSARATTPTTFCPTIASALWRPLWPPGEL